MRWGSHLLIQTLHDGYHLYDDLMLFDLAVDPHETTNLAAANPQQVQAGLQRLDAWYVAMMANAARGRDPLLNVIKEGGPFHIKGQLDKYLVRLRATNRHSYADALERKHPGGKHP